MTMYRVEVKRTDWEDWGGSYFHVFARNEHEAWKEAERLEPGNVKRLWAVKYIGE